MFLTQKNPNQPPGGRKRLLSHPLHTDQRSKQAGSCTPSPQGVTPAQPGSCSQRHIRQEFLSPPRANAVTAVNYTRRGADKFDKCTNCFSSVSAGLRTDLSSYSDKEGWLHPLRSLFCDQPTETLSETGLGRPSGAKKWRWLVAAGARSPHVQLSKSAECRQSLQNATAFFGGFYSLTSPQCDTETYRKH